MIKAVTITNYIGESVKINLFEADPKHGFIIESIDGLGPAKAVINMTDMATSDGSMYNSARLEKRNIVMRLRLTYAPDIETSRQRTYKYFPIKRPLTFMIETDNRTAAITGYVESNEPDIFSSDETVSISIICDDPYFYSAGKDGVNVTTFTGMLPQFEFPFENDDLENPVIELGTIENETEKNIYYAGDAEVGIVINIHAIGDARNITIINANTREQMKINTDLIQTFTGKKFDIGDTIVISTVRGDKYVRLIRSGKVTNILNCISRDSDWFQLRKGDNWFVYDCDDGVEFLEFQIENRVIYEGV